jgi:hypothetical protein
MAFFLSLFIKLAAKSSSWRIKAKSSAIAEMPLLENILL